MSDGNKIIEVQHPDYSAAIQDWIKWRLTYYAGDIFINTYLQKFSARESDDDFKTRRALTYCPAFAQAAVNDVKNAIYQRCNDISRQGGALSYQRAASGADAGVDLLGSDMNSFIGRKILPELLVLGKVGIFVDMPSLPDGATLADKAQLHPYLYYYQAEDIPCWDYDESNQPYEFQAILLRDWVYIYDKDSNLPKEQVYRYRHMWREDGVVYVQFYNEAGIPCDKSGDISYPDPVILNIPTIPFIVLTISSSLMANIANYQIAHLNASSADMMYIMKANFPFYVEQFDARAEMAYLRPPGEDNAGLALTADTGANKEIRVGVAQGRRYPLNANQPSFIHPSSEPLQASMAKQESLKSEIRQLINLAVTNLQPKMASAESKSFDERGLEAGLSYIGLELEQAERLIGRYWSLYENAQAPTIYYPRNYSLKTEAERRDEAKALQAQMETVPSITFKRNMAKQIVDITLGTKVSAEDLAKIYIEIDNAPAIIGSADTLATDVINGLVSLETASKVRGYPPGEAEKAKQDHADRLTRIAISQSNAGARGVAPMDPNPGLSAKDEKAASRDVTTKDTTKIPVRGKGK